MDCKFLNYEYSQAMCWNAWMGSAAAATDGEMHDFHCMLDMGGEL